MEVRREHSRHAVDLKVDCSTRDAFLSSRVTNLSRGGLFIRGDRSLPVGSEVDLTLTLAGSGTRIRARGRVIWNYDILKGTSHVVPGMGIKLLDLTSEDHRRLGEFLDSLCPAGTPAAAN
jgi:uncharacterized protein (TIGR02266 family)